MLMFVRDGEKLVKIVEKITMRRGAMLTSLLGYRPFKTVASCWTKMSYIVVPEPGLILRLNDQKEEFVNLFNIELVV